MSRLMCGRLKPPKILKRVGDATHPPAIVVVWLHDHGPAGGQGFSAGFIHVLHFNEHLNRFAPAFTGFQAALGIGGAVWGAVTAQSNTSAALISAAIGLGLTAVVGRLLPVGATQELDITPSERWAPHTMSAEPNPSDGPVLIYLIYEIPPENETPFRAVMQRLRLIRLRDGAVRWSLSKNLDQPRQFREAFIVGSWGEHLRQHARATASDKQIEEAAVAFHVDQQRPKAEHYLMVES